MNGRIDYDQLNRQLELLEARWDDPSISPLIAELPSFIGTATEPTRTRLKSALIGIDIEYRWSRKQNVKPADYVPVFPNDYRLILDCFRRMSVPPPQLGPYSMIREIGRGAFGTVYLGRDNTLDRLVAIKIPHSGVHIPLDTIEEAQMASRLRHPNIVSVLHVYSDEITAVAIVSEYIDGPSLEQWMKQPHPEIDPREIVALLICIANALDYANSNESERLGIVHRDVKPANILLEKVSDSANFNRDAVTTVRLDQVIYRPRLIDFGLSVNELMQNKQLGVVAGTPSYMSIEQTHGERLRSTSDVWSLGVIFYELLTGERPFRGRSPVDVFAEIRSCNVRSLREINRNIPQALEYICLGNLQGGKGCLKRNPADRLTTWQLADALRDYLAESTEANVSLDNRTNPYRGLEAFRIEDADLFFGRRDRIHQLIDKLRQVSLLAVVGPSGAGKSSLIQAGLLSRMVADGWTVLPIRLQSEPFLSSLQAVKSQLEDFTQTTADLEPSAELFHKYLWRLGNQRKRLIVYIDQFEELFTLADTDMKDRFLNCLLAPWVTPGNWSEISMKLIVSFRTEFLDLAMLHPDLRELLDSYGTQVVGQLNQREIREAIVKPANRRGVSVDSSLVERILSDVGTDPGSLPLLGYCLKRLWDFQNPVRSDALSCDSYENIGGFHGAISNHADQVLAELQRLGLADSTRLLFKQLVKVDPEDPRRDARRPGSINELSRLPITGWADTVGQIVAKLTRPETRLLVRDDDQVEIAHEALIREWGTLRGWVEEDRDFQIKRDRVQSFRKNNEQIPTSTLTDCELWLTEPARLNELDHDTRQFIEDCVDRFVQLQIRQLFGSKTDQLTAIINEFVFRERMKEKLKLVFERKVQEFDQEQQRRIGLALLLLGEESLIDFLGMSLLSVPHPDEFTILSQNLVPYAAKLIPNLRTALKRTSTDAAMKLRAAAALVILGGHHAASRKWAPDIAEQLIREAPADIGGWTQILMDERDSLKLPLRSIAISQSRTDIQRFLAIHILRRLSGGDDSGNALPPEWTVFLIDMAQDLAAAEFLAIVPTIAQSREAAVLSLQHRLRSDVPLDSESSDQSHKWRARLAILYARIQDLSYVSAFLRHDSDPSLRSHLIHSLGALEVDAPSLVNLLIQETSDQNRIPLIFSLGGFDEVRLSKSERKPVIELLKSIFQDSTRGGGIHGATEWLLRKWGHESWLNSKNRNWSGNRRLRQQQLQAARSIVRGPEDNVRPSWFVNSQGQSFIVIDGHQPFLMGSPRREPFRGDSEMLHWRRIGRTFAIGAKHVTWAEWLQYLEKTQQHAEIETTQKYRTKSPDDFCPVTFVSWHMVARYCNWLSEQEELEPCYRIAGMETTAGEAQLVSGYLTQRNGYRLPTDAEMEFATRAGTRTARCYGETDELLHEYGWYSLNAHDRTWPVGLKKPNDWGLFDVHGNCFTWCQQFRDEYGFGPEHEVHDDDTSDWKGKPIVEDREGPLTPSEPKLVLRGGMYFDPASDVRSAYRHVHPPTSQENFIGFRLARTLSTIDSPT